MLTVDGSGSGLDADLLRGVAPSNLAVLSATKLANTRTIWGQNFNGEGNVRGSINNVIDIIADTYSIHDSTTNPYLKLTSNGLKLS